LAWNDDGSAASPAHSSCVKKLMDEPFARPKFLEACFTQQACLPRRESNMRKLVLALAASGALAGCTTAEQTAVGGAATGAVIGGVVDGAEGALVGAAAGAVAGYLIGKAATPGYCIYEDRRYSPPRRYEARC